MYLFFQVGNKEIISILHMLESRQSQCNRLLERKSTSNSISNILAFANALASVRERDTHTETQGELKVAQQQKKCQKLPI